MEIKIKELAQVEAAIKEFLPLLQKHKIFLLRGEMGAGKTTFTQELLLQLGLKDLEGSPTYSLINSYQSEDYGPIYHLDLFRLQKIEEALDIGLEELLSEDAYLFIEWPDLILPLLPPNFAELNFKVHPNLERSITINSHE